MGKCDVHSLGTRLKYFANNLLIAWVLWCRLFISNEAGAMVELCHWVFSRIHHIVDAAGLLWFRLSCVSAQR